MDELIRQAMAERRVIAYRYNSQRRVGEPHLYGLLEGQPTLLVYQTGGTSHSGPYPNWRRCALGGITHLTLTSRTFQHPRLRSDDPRSEWTEVWAIVE